jgi:glycosyltransferase involved in cell wall biosynthesis
MKVVIVSFFYDENLDNEEALLRRHYTTTGWAEGLQRNGVEVVVINRFYRDSKLVKNNVCYLFVKDKLGPSFSAWQVPLHFLKKISSLQADIVHLHHLTLSPQTSLLRLLLPRETAIVIQHHGGKTPAKIKRFIHNTIHQVADGFFFVSGEQGKEWFMGNRQYKKVFEVMEGSTFFNYNNRDQARQAGYYNRDEARKKTGITGSPVFLWVGRLDDNKDPLTVLDGFETIRKVYKEASLYMIYSDEKLLERVIQQCEGNQSLGSNVFLTGRIAHEQIEMYYNSADYFVLGSHYEGSGYALSEALRCGCVPIVTAIPSFRMMTNNGQLGALWHPGDAGSFVASVKNAMGKPLSQEARACINYYNDALSFDAIAEKAICHYQKLLEKRRKFKTALSNA